MRNMLKIFTLSLLAVCSVSSLLAQSDRSAPVTLVVKPLDGEIGKIAGQTAAAASAPFVLNIMTVIGQNSVGLPCYNCVTGIASPNLGILEPSGYIVKGGAASQIDAFLYDFNYTGSCTFTIEIVDKTKTVVASTTPSFSFTAPTTIALGTALSIPSTAAIGIGFVQTIAVCGTSTSKSASPVLIY